MKNRYTQFGDIRKSFDAAVLNLDIVEVTVSVCTVQEVLRCGSQVPWKTSNLYKLFYEPKITPLSSDE